MRSSFVYYIVLHINRVCYKFNFYGACGASLLLLLLAVQRLRDLASLLAAPHMWRMLQPVN